MSEAQLEVQVAKAPLDSERALRFRGAEREYQATADAGQVTLPEGRQPTGRDSIRGLVRVLIVEEDPRLGRVLVQLPGEVVMGGRRVWVPRDLLRR